MARGLSLSALACSSQHIKQDGYEPLIHPDRHKPTHRHEHTHTQSPCFCLQDYIGVKPNCLSDMMGTSAKTKSGLSGVFFCQLHVCLFQSVVQFLFILFTPFSDFFQLQRASIASKVIARKMYTCVRSVFPTVLVFCACMCVWVCVSCRWASLSMEVSETSETLPLVNSVSLMGVNDVNLCNHSVHICVYVCLLDGEKAVHAIGGDLDGHVRTDVYSSHHSSSSVFHWRT